MKHFYTFNPKSAMLALTMLFAAGSAMAAAPVSDIPGKVLAKDYDTELSVLHNQNAGTEGGGNIGNTSPDDQWVYSINCTKAGAYKVTLSAANGSGDHAGSYILKIDGKDVANGSIPNKENAWGEYNDYVVNISYISEGEHTLTFFVVRDPINLMYMDFEWLGADAVYAEVPGKIEARDFDDESTYQETKDRILAEGGHISNLHANDSFIYPFTCTQDGTYDINVHAANGNDPSEYELYVDDVKVGSGTVANSGWGTYLNSTVSGVKLTKGNHTFKFYVVSEPMNVEYFEFINKTATGIESIEADSNAPVNVYGIDGRLVRANVAASEAVDGLAPGIYIVGNKKVLVTR